MATRPAEDGSISSILPPQPSREKSTALENMDQPIGGGTSPGKRLQESVNLEASMDLGMDTNLTQQVKHVLGKVVHHHVLTIINTPESHEGGQVACHTKLALKQHLAKVGRRFTQANDTPFLQPQLLNIFGKIGINKRL